MNLDQLLDQAVLKSNYCFVLSLTRGREKVHITIGKEYYGIWNFTNKKPKYYRSEEWKQKSSFEFK